MIKKIWALLLVVELCSSCFIFSPLRKRTFEFPAGNTSQTLRVLVPKRYQKKQTFTDSSGNQQDFYSYSNGAVLYIIQSHDTLRLFQPIDTASNIALPHLLGGTMYKGLDSNNLFWREIRTDSFRFGYRFVPTDVEPVFDSAVNYAAKRRFKK
ncbi:MAG TPA: hypothetical protein VM010_06480 [Chitinophagaceae bacterium]|nr:hypothetical protein [Chitinophagaceae bacterium]